ncbi:hypothetical protein M9434_000694 [Picochlorum sp. BPE23]|nr:hypothetical protein M9434_000694 [Picochlorum sp. BPE23]
MTRIAFLCREKKTEKSKDDQLLESLISLCIQDTFPYCKGYFKKNMEKLEDFERIPAKHFAVLMQNIMEVLHFDQETIKSFRGEIHLKIKEHNASVHPSPIKTQEHTNSCCSHWQSDASDLLTANVNNKYVKFIMRSATSYSQCMKVAVLDGLITNIHSASSVSIPGHLEPDHVQTSSAFVGNRHPVSPIKRACPSPSPGMPVHKKSCWTPQHLFHQFSQQPQPTMQPEKNTCNMNHISMLQKWSPEQGRQLYHPSPPNMDNNQIPSDLNNINLSGVFDDIGLFPTISIDS